MVLWLKGWTAAWECVEISIKKHWRLPREHLAEFNMDAWCDCTLSSNHLCYSSNMLRACTWLSKWKVLHSNLYHCLYYNGIFWGIAVLPRHHKKSWQIQNILITNWNDGLHFGKKRFKIILIVLNSNLSKVTLLVFIF